MIIKTKEQIANMTFEQVSRCLYSSIYEATKVLETLEYQQRVRGNGHVMRQKMADRAVEFLKERWIEKAEITEQ